MKTIYIYCEGPTEESFINAVLYPYFLGMGIYVCPIVCETRRDANRKYRGGVSRYAKVKNELMILCKSHPHEYVTTMFDYDVENIRIAKSEQRDLLQDLRDVADGLEVVHAVDLKKEQAAKKRESRQRRREQKERRLNKRRSPAPPKEEQLTLLTEEEHFSDGSQTD